jgi:hypothetical protein
MRSLARFSSDPTPLRLLQPGMKAAADGVGFLLSDHAFPLPASRYEENRHSTLGGLET